MKIMLNGLPSSGKDTVANYLSFYYGFKKLAFADGIYQIAEDYFGMLKKDRQLLRDIGEKLREIDENVWVKNTFKQGELYENVVITDCRRDNEYDEGIKRGYKPIKITMNEDKRLKLLEKRDGKLDTSLTECETQAYDREYFEIENNNELASLIIQIDWIMEKHGIEKIREVSRGGKLD